MTEVLINAKIRQRKQAELFQTVESIKGLLLRKCSHFDIDYMKNRNLKIKIIFNGSTDTEKIFNGMEFNILKGALLSLCDDVNIIQNQNSKSPEED